MMVDKMDKDAVALIAIVAVVVGGFLVMKRLGGPPSSPPVKKFHVEGTVYFDTPPSSLSNDLSNEYSAKEGTVDNIGVYKYTTGVFSYLYNYEKIGTIKLEPGPEETTTPPLPGPPQSHFEENIPSYKIVQGITGSVNAENLCIGFLSGAPHPDDGYTRIEIDENTKNIELHYWDYVGPLPE